MISTPARIGRQAGQTRGDGAAIFMGLIFIAVGIYIMLAGFGITHIGKLLVDPWVVVVVGIVFALFGVALFYQVSSASVSSPGFDRYGQNLIIQAEERPAKLVSNWFITLIWNGIVGVFWFLILSGAKGEGSIWVAYVVLAIFTPIGLWLIYWSIKVTLSAIRFGSIPLHMNPSPDSKHRTLMASLQVPRIHVLKTLNTKLTCYEVRWERYRDSKGRTRTSQSKKEFWRSAIQHIPVRPGSRVEISIDIPPLLPGTSVSLNAGYNTVNLDTDYYAWMLEVTADVPGVDLYRTYEVPVAEATAAMQSAAAHTDTEVTEYMLHKAAAVRTVAEAQLAAGKSADSIADTLFNQGNAMAVIRTGMQLIADDPASPHRGSAQGWIARQKKMQSEIDSGQLMMLDRAAGPRTRQPSLVPASAGRYVGQGSITFLDKLQRSRQARQEGPVLKWVAVLLAFAPFLFIAGVVAYQFRGFWSHSTVIHQGDPQRAAEIQAQAKAMQQRFHDYQIIPVVNTGYIYVAGRGISAEQHGKDLYLKLAEIKLEKQENKDEVSYVSLGINVYQNPNKNLGSTWTREIRGTLTTEAPVAILHDQVFVLPNIGSSCNTAGCRARLLLSVPTGPAGSYAENTAFAGFSTSPGTSIALNQTPSKYWDTYYNSALAARRQNRFEDAIRLFQQTLDFIEQNLGPEHPATARTLVTRASLYKKLNKPELYEQDMQHAYAILDQYPDETVKKELGANFYWIDKEEVARWLGDYYWDAYRYQDSFKYYQLAYEAAPDLSTTDYSRNLKLAFSSAGVMKTACTLGKWELADKAMAELKRRYKDVEPASQKELDYWINTGEPRLKNRKC